MFQHNRVYVGVVSVIFSLGVSASDVEVITIQAQQQSMATESNFAVGNSIQADSADWLASVPGANVNKNGPVSGIAQYRGMFGDRVSVKIDGYNVIGSGPNAMDAPLSYVVPVMLESMSVYRGIAPVSSGMDTIGGAVSVDMKEAEFSTSDWEISGLFQAGYRSNNEADSASFAANIANDKHALLSYYSYYDADNYDSGDDNLVYPTQYEKEQFGLDYRFQYNSGKVGFSYHKTETDDAGTPALAMDIEYISGDRFGLSGTQALSGWDIDWSLGYMESDHGMANFLFRPVANPAAFRNTTAEADTLDFKVHAKTPLPMGSLLVGVDGYMADHDAFITNPNNPAFLVNNFNDVEDNRIGLLAEWTHFFGKHQASVGGRIKFNQSDAGEVSHFMAANNPMVASLVNQFNDADRDDTETNFDFAATVNRIHNANLSFSVGVGVKQRAPSYQEKFLWFPLPVTGGLADGKVYVGNLNLDSETAYQFNMGATYNTGDFSISPNVFYQRIDDYIQGTPSTNAQVINIARMMAGDDSPLQFNNVDAEIYGLDLHWRYNASKHFLISGTASYIKGERRDIDDDLYRIAPPNASIKFSYFGDTWQGDISLTGYANQDDVSLTNLESETPGYGLIDASVSYFFDKVTLQAGVDNLFDREYARHLSGINRAIGGDVAVGDKVLAEGRNLFVKVQYQF
ncbi:TonB-dependent receptor [Alteromonas sp. a30]|uniref:TonB-dependent receptor n=1 Tax=Alteromonas sp. a30 TaxID=2730917 RepID=UPI0022810F85|nr:TonB-dependent receptor [Alteromonas sp. a30]MCY7294765.1 TonB-dependent receptor [Alteromonas sp. a30]